MVLELNCIGLGEHILMKTKYRKKPMFRRKIHVRALEASQENFLARSHPGMMEDVQTGKKGGHPLVQVEQNASLREYEVRIKAAFDEIPQAVQALENQLSFSGFSTQVQALVQSKLGVTLSSDVLNQFEQLSLDKDRFYSECVFAQFMAMSKEFFEQDPLKGQNRAKAENMFRRAGFHAVGIAPCADGRLAHLISYVLRLPYSLVRRKAHAGALFDVSESVRNWVFIEHSRFREGVPNSIEEPTRYLKIAVYHYSASDPSHQGCAAHGSDDFKAAEAALSKLSDFKQAIENRFGCGSTVQTLLIGMNTDDDSLKVHIPDKTGKVCLNRFIETNTLFHQTIKMTAEQARVQIQQAISQCNARQGITESLELMNELIAWFIENNFSQIEYVNQYEKGCYSDIGHAERFIGIGNGFEEVQIRNLTYYSYLDTVEEGFNDVDVGIKIFTGLNIKHGRPIPIIIRCDYDGRVPGSKERARKKAERIEKAVHNRYSELSNQGKLYTLCTLRDNTGYQPAERISGLLNSCHEGGVS